MSNLFSNIDFSEYYFPYIPMGLTNEGTENKCWANSTLQALKASPAFRNFIFKKIKGLYVDEVEKGFWSLPLVRSFWESFLYNELRCGHLKSADAQSRFFQHDLRGTANKNRTIFGYLELPLNEAEFGYSNSYPTNAEHNPIQDVVDGFNVADKVLRLGEQGVFVDLLPKV